MAGMIAAVEEKGYAATTIADIARAARMSRRTLYEHFPDKEACFLAAYGLMSDTLITAVVDAARQAPAGMERVRAATSAYLDELSNHVEIVRSFFTEIKAVGQPGLELSCRVNERFAAMLTDLMTEVDAEAPLPDGRIVRPLNPELSLAIVGGINELVLHAIVQGPRDTLATRLRRLEEPVTQIAERMLLADPG